MALDLFNRIVDRSITVLTQDDLVDINIIGITAFEGCLSLTDVTTPSNVESIKQSAFIGCSALNNLIMQEGLKIIEETAFSGCTGLTSITIPSTVVNIGVRAFGNSSGAMNITNIYFNHSNGSEILFSTDDSGYGPFRVKTARSANIYTDNDYIRNWDWSTHENITPTFYHLDGTAW